MPKAEVAEIISAVADALDYAHSRGLLHRDVKPANILLSSTSQAGTRRRILLADFGIARELGEISGLTATNMLVGTTAYCAPEQLQGADLGARADQYALGCTAFNLLTGAAPFQHSNPAVVISHHLSAPPPLISERRPDLAELDPVIAKVARQEPRRPVPELRGFRLRTGRPGARRRGAHGGDLRTDASGSGAHGSDRGAPRHPGRRNPAGGARPPCSPHWPPSRCWRWPRSIGVHMLRTHSSNAAGGGNAPSASAPPTTGGAAPPATPALTLSGQVTDQSGVLGPIERTAVERAVTKLYNLRGTRLWVVYVNNFGGLRPFKWAENLMRANGFADTDAMLAVATDEPSFSFRVPGAIGNGKAIDVEAIRRDRIAPAVYHREWARAAIAAATGLDVAPG